MALWDLSLRCAELQRGIFPRRLYTRCNWLQDARGVEVEDSTLCAGDASNVAGKKNLAEEKKRFHTGRRKHDNEPFWPQLGPVVFLAVIFLINFIARIILSPLLPTIEKELAISHGQAGSFVFLISGGYVIGPARIRIPSVPFKPQNYHRDFHRRRWTRAPGDFRR